PVGGGVPLAWLRFFKAHVNKSFVCWLFTTLWRFRRGYTFLWNALLGQDALGGGEMLHFLIEL
ncbi:MAG: hypothetical protein P8Y67_04760, partial [Alphaproteobacteria bacterium]